MATMWTEKQKTEMQKMRDEGFTNADIGQRFGVAGEIIRKVLARYNAGKTEARELAATGKSSASDRLRRLHDEFDAKAPERATSRPQWAGRPPLRIMPKDFR